MSSTNGTRREFVKQSGMAAAAAAVGVLDPLKAVSKLGMPGSAASFDLVVEMSGLWFLAVVNSQLFALISPNAHRNLSTTDDDEDVTHLPRLFIHKEHGPKGGTDDPDEPNQYSWFDINGSISWPSSVRRLTKAALPPHVTNLTRLTNHPLNMTHVNAAPKIPLNFGTPTWEFPEDTTFKYEYAEGKSCSWGENVQLAWKLTFQTAVSGESLTLALPNGPTQTLRPNDKNELRLQFKNTTKKHSHARKPKPGEDNDKFASHFVVHYHFLKGYSGRKCYPVRMEHKFLVSGLYTCMMGGGGG